MNCMKYAKIFIKIMVMLTYILLGYVLFLYYTRFLEHVCIDIIEWGLIILLVFFTSMRMWKDVNKV